MFVRLGFAVAANVEPDVLLIDEVLSVGDEVFQRRCAEKIEEFRRDGRTIIFVSHGLAQVEQLCEQVAWIDHGELVELGPASEVITPYRGDSHEDDRVEADGDAVGEPGGRDHLAGFVDDDGEPAPLLTTLEPATLRLEYEAHQPLQDVVFGFRSTPCTVTSSGGRARGWPARRLPRSTGRARSNSPIDQLPLLEGVYVLSVSITDQAEVREYDHWERGSRFEVRQYATNDAGLVHMPVTWRIHTTVHQS